MRNEKFTFLNAAVKSGKWEAVSTLIEHGAPLTLEGRIGQDKNGPVHGHAIHAAILYGQNEILQKLLKSYRQLIEDEVILSQGTKEEQVFTPILLAISVGGDKLETVKTLLNHGAHFDPLDPKFQPNFKLALIKMLEHDNAKVFNYLVKQNKINIFT